jgi:hypothetical protein
MICLLQRSRKVFREWNFKIFKLFLKTLLELVSSLYVSTCFAYAVTHLIQFVLALLRIIDGRVVSIVEEVSCSNKPIATVVSRTTSD